MADLFDIRYNLIDVFSLEDFASVKGGYNNQTKDVYFIRALGENRGLMDNLLEIDKRLYQEMNEGKLKYLRFTSLPKLLSQEDIGFYSGAYENWKNSKQINLRKLETNQELLGAISDALVHTVEMFAECGKNTSASMEKNFVTKLLFWLDSLMAESLVNWKIQNYVKVITDNKTKEQEYLFCYLLTRIGCDVLIIENQKDLDGKESLKELSATFTLGNYGNTVLKEFEPYIPVAPIQRTTGNIAPAGNQNPQMVNKENSGPVVVKLPDRNRPRRNGTVASTATSTPVVAQAPVQQIPVRTQNMASINRDEEKSFEELALLASSIVMIAVHKPNGDVMATGSGIMIGRNGYILTNNHVAAGGAFYSVRIEDDEEIYMTNEVIKYHPNLDLAVIRIQRTLTPLPLFDGRKKLVRGQKVVAIGSPLGLFNSVSDGIISGFRKIRDVDMIQFTAPISSGSSGGAVLNMQGEIIGISTAGFDHGQNINLAVGFEDINRFAGGFIDFK